MRKQTLVLLLTLVGFLALGVMAVEPPTGSFEQHTDCMDCYSFELEYPDGSTRDCLACLSLPASTAMGCYQVGICGCVAIWPGQCHNC